MGGSARGQVLYPDTVAGAAPEGGPLLLLNTRPPSCPSGAAAPAHVGEAHTCYLLINLYKVDWVRLAERACLIHPRLIFHGGLTVPHVRARAWRRASHDARATPGAHVRAHPRTRATHSGCAQPCGGGRWATAPRQKMSRRVRARASGGGVTDLRGSRGVLGRSPGALRRPHATSTTCLPLGAHSTPSPRKCTQKKPSVRA